MSHCIATHNNGKLISKVTDINIIIAIMSHIKTEINFRSSPRAILSKNIVTGTACRIYGLTEPVRVKIAY